MPRAKYTITADDVMHATFYISGRLQTYGFTFDHYETARSEYRTAMEMKTKPARAVAVNAWCEKYLAGEDWRKMKAAIRKRRHRWEHYEDQHTVTISKRSHELLAKVSQRDKVTFSEVLEHYLPKALRTSRGRAKPGR